MTMQNTAAVRQPTLAEQSEKTLQDIMSHGSLHWRGDRADLAAFNPAYVSLMGREQQITAEEMQAFGDFLGVCGVGGSRQQEDTRGEGRERPR